MGSVNFVVNMMNDRAGIAQSV